MLTDDVTVADHQVAGEPGGGAARWGPAFGARARDWAATWEGPRGWGTPVYQHLLDRAPIDAGTRVLDCGCGAGRFVRMAADRGAVVAGIDAAAPLIEIAAERTPQGELRVGDLEALPWSGGSFDVVAGLSSFQFADDKVRALTEARRVARGQVAVAIPGPASESGLGEVIQALLPLFAPEVLEGLRKSGIFALSEPGRLEEALAGAGLDPGDDSRVDCPIGFEDADDAVRAFLGAGPVQFAIERSGEEAVAGAVRGALGPFTADDGEVSLPGWFRVVLARPRTKGAG